MITLRDYQERGVAAIRDAMTRLMHRRVLYTLPTGGGKTVLFCYVAQSAVRKGNTVAIMVHRRELVEQVSRTLHGFGQPHGIMAADYTPSPSEPVQVCSIDTLARRLWKVRDFDVIIIDEAHHMMAKTWLSVGQRFANAVQIGVTATPCRLDGKGLGNFFDYMVKGPTVAELTDMGYLVPAKYWGWPVDLSGVHTRHGDYAPHELAERLDKPKLIGDMLAHYRQICPGKKTVAFAVNRLHAEHIAETFRQGGYRAETLLGDLPKAERLGRTKKFESGELQLLSTVDVVSEGYDLPGIEAVILGRSTQSLAMFLQQVGRMLRTAPGKQFGCVLDHAGNVLRHGYAHIDRDWTLEGGAGEDTEKRPLPPKQCPRCYRIVPAHKPVCECGFQWTKKTEIPLDLLNVNGQLIEYKLEGMNMREMQDTARRIVHKMKSEIAYLREIARRKGYNPNWANHVIMGRLEKQLKSESGPLDIIELQRQIAKAMRLPDEPGK